MNDFDEAYEDEDDVYGEPYERLLEFFGSRPPGRILDLGSGQGRNAVALAALGHDVTAVDSSVVGVRQTVERGAARGRSIRGIAADLADFPIRGRFDVVLVDMVLHGLDDDVRTRLLEALPTAVAAGGGVYAVVPEAGAVLDEVVTALVEWSPRVEPVEHVLTRGEHAGVYEFIAVTAERLG